MPIDQEKELLLNIIDELRGQMHAASGALALDLHMRLERIRMCLEMLVRTEIQQSTSKTA
jgi:hypothetical protein